MATTQQELTVLGTRPITADELLTMHSEGKRGELIRGVFCPTMPAGIRHGRIAMKLGHLLLMSIGDSGSGTVVGTDSGVQLEWGPDTVREPDIAYFSKERMPLDEDVPGYAQVPPDIVVEIASPSDSANAVTDKARMWIGAGVRLVWVLWPETRMIDVHRPGEQTVTLRETDTLTGSDILPQFTCPVKDIFEV